MNGVCVIWRGWIDLHRLDGIGCIEFDSERAEVKMREREREREILFLRLAALWKVERC